MMLKILGFVLMGAVLISGQDFEEEDRIWTGPIADHVLGERPQDTPEVAEAKARHFSAFNQVLKALPELPPEIRYQQSANLDEEGGFEDDLNVPSQHIPFPVHFVRRQEVEEEPESFPVRELAEDIPRSSVGETPEVHAARIAHLQAFLAARSSLPSIAQKPLPSF